MKASNLLPFQGPSTAEKGDEETPSEDRVSKSSQERGQSNVFLFQSNSPVKFSTYQGLQAPRSRPVGGQSDPGSKQKGKDSHIHARRDNRNGVTISELGR